jgi:putative flippase GtrA
MKNNRELVNYFVFGVLTTVINILSYSFFTKALTINYKAATLVAWLVSVIFAYVTNKLYVFNSESKTLVQTIKELSSFVMFRVLSVILDLLCMILLVDGLMINDLFAKIITNGLVIIVNFFASKYIIFNKQTHKESNESTNES